MTQFETLAMSIINLDDKRAEPIRLAAIVQMDTSKVEAALASHAAPRCYIHEGEHKWICTDVERYMRKRKALHYTRKADSYKESAV